MLNYRTIRQEEAHQHNNGFRKQRIFVETTNLYRGSAEVGQWMIWL